MSPITRRPDFAHVLAAIDLAALLDELTQPAASPGARRWHCPLADHDDRHPSVTMFTDHRGHQRWRCWSGDDTHRGDAIDLVSATRHLTRSEAITWLATRHRLDLDQLGDAGPRRTREPAPVMTTNLSGVVVDYARRCADLLWTPCGVAVRDWLHRRGLGDDILRANHVGADPGYRQLPRRHGLPKGASPAATFPAHDASGAVTYVQTRYLDPGERPKYDNPAARLGPNPRIAWTRVPTTAATLRPGVLIVCEGIPDALTAAQAGYRAVAMLGSHAANEDTADRIADHARRHHLAIVAVVDADPAGRAAGQRLAHHLVSRGRHVNIVEPAIGNDLNQWAYHDPHWHQTIASSSRDTAHYRGLDL